MSTETKQNTHEQDNTIQFNSPLCANLTAQKPVTELA
jgi:hypothetical protein